MSSDRKKRIARYYVRQAEKLILANDRMLQSWFDAHFPESDYMRKMRAKEAARRLPTPPEGQSE